jgi:hypothetical protein
MTISVSMLYLLVGTALTITIAAPVVLIALFVRDWNKGDLW